MDKYTIMVREVLNENMLHINDGVSCVTDLLVYLTCVLTEYERELISNKERNKCKQDAVEKLVKTLCRKDGKDGREAFSALLRALKESKNESLASDLERSLKEKQSK